MVRNCPELQTRRGLGGATCQAERKTRHHFLVSQAGQHAENSRASTSAASPAPAISDPEPNPKGSCIGKFHAKLYFRTLDKGPRVHGPQGAAAPLSTIERQPFTDLSTSRAPCQPWNSSSTARRGAGNRRFWLLSPRRAHAKAP
jgi:hypothetical protein